MQDDLEARLVEALPWLLFRYWNLDKSWLVQQAKLLDLQNRLGFVVSLARQLAERTNSPAARLEALKGLELDLEQIRLAREDSLCKALKPTEKQWLRENRPEKAKHWNLLTDWRPEILPYAV
ncbi:MAG TPA: hypothetical protein VGL91_07935 [Acidobacteriota bacterium]|jgi:hypothetical protein